ncbi:MULTISPECIES: hypothetical protein [Streptomyces]|uniref:Sensor histidine kinase n=1 Tax=Streptomyces doudnae TaxID=3075536 RepID=A0ABD5ENM6_9ACTN|nr:MULTISPECIES: hypothetical protein [unclassified Streptomyces]MDT0435659.1 hypothetical protein [Streptomyces sp. DSM 41981]MYQ62614.1 hypothetical protein [Streptomyces sp. SID4950]SCD40787.1 hypothetical protein GA0115242_1048118 [Streptomyces sp. SolWspMP-5a-2]
MHDLSAGPGLLVLAALLCIAGGLLTFVTAGVIALCTAISYARSVRRVRTLHRQITHGDHCTTLEGP